MQRRTATKQALWTTGTVAGWGQVEILQHLPTQLLSPSSTTAARHVRAARPSLLSPVPRILPTSAALRSAAHLRTNCSYIACYSALSCLPPRIHSAQERAGTMRTQQDDLITATDVQAHWATPPTHHTHPSEDDEHHSCSTEPGQPTTCRHGVLSCRPREPGGNTWK